MLFNFGLASSKVGKVTLKASSHWSSGIHLGKNSSKDLVTGIGRSSDPADLHYPQTFLRLSTAEFLASWSSEPLARALTYLKKPLEHSLQKDSCHPPKQGWKQSFSSHSARSKFSGLRNDPKTFINLEVRRVTLVLAVCVTLIMYLLSGVGT